MKNIFYVVVCLVLFSSPLSAISTMTVPVDSIDASTKVYITEVYPSGFSLEIAKHTTPKMLYDFRYHDTLAGADFSLASYKVLVLNGGWASSVDRSNGRGVVLAGLTVELQRSQYIRNFTSSVLPNIDYGIFNNLGVGGFVGWDFDINEYRYGVYMGIVFDSLSSWFKGKRE